MPPPSRQRWPRRLIWALATCSLLIPVLIIIQTNLIRFAANAEQADRAVQILRWMGRETTGVHVDLGDRFAAAGNRPEAVRHYRRSIELFPTGQAWAALGFQHRAQLDWEAALGAFEAAIKLSPSLVGAEFRRAEALLAIGAAASVSRAEAIASLERVLEMEPGHAGAAMLLARVQSENGEIDHAILTLETSLAVVAPSNRNAIRAQLGALRRAPPL